MKIFWEQIFKVSIWGILPVFLISMVILCMVIIKCMKKEELSTIENFCDKKKFNKSQKVYSKVDYVSEIYFFPVLLWELFHWQLILIRFIIRILVK